MKKYIILTILLLNFINLEAQPLTNVDDRKFFIGNVLSSGVVCSINACVNKSSKKSFSKTLVNSFWKGCLGGVLDYTGKKLVQESSYKNSYSYIWPAKLIHSMGTSITENGANNQKIFSSISMDIYFTHIKYDGKIHCQIDPITLGSAMYFSTTKNFTFNPKVSLATGTVVFDKKPDDFIPDGNATYLFKDAGQAIGNTIWRKVCKQWWYDWYGKIQNPVYGTVYTSDIRSIKTYDKSTICHELIHTFQYSEYNIFSTSYMNKINLKILNNFNINMNFALMYSIANLNGYQNNYFENEADYFGKSILSEINSTYH